MTTATLTRNTKSERLSAEAEKLTGLATYDVHAELDLSSIDEMTDDRSRTAFDCIDDGIHRQKVDHDGDCLTCGFP